MVSYEEAVRNLERAYTILSRVDHSGNEMTGHQVFVCRCAIADALAILREPETPVQTKVGSEFTIRNAGKWILDRPHKFRCSSCGANWGLAAGSMHYCPTCGSAMTMPEEELRKEFGRLTHCGKCGTQLVYRGNNLCPICGSEVKWDG